MTVMAAWVSAVLTAVSGCTGVLAHFLRGLRHASASAPGAVLGAPCALRLCSHVLGARNAAPLRAICFGGARWSPHSCLPRSMCHVAAWGRCVFFFFCAKTWAEVAILLLLHEVWVTLQHGNVLLNPFCQRLDRQYGIAMLRRGQHWVIASVLVMYWSREVASMLLCLPYLSFKTQVAIFGSVVYHMVKMLSVCKDAQRKLG